MSGNSFGKILRLSTFGESHSEAIGGVLDGLPANVSIDYDLLKHDLQRRRGAKFFFETPRAEDDEVQFLSGIFEGKTLGTPIGFIIPNKNKRPEDYKALKNIYRPSHADYTYERKFGLRDYRGGGRASARETLARVVGGALAKMYLAQYDIEIMAYVSQIGDVKLQKSIEDIDFGTPMQAPLFCPDEATSKKILKHLKEVFDNGDTVGGVISCVVRNVIPGLGEPVFDKLQARLAYAMLGIPAVKGFEYGAGFKAASMKGSEQNDEFISDGKSIRTKTNMSGGIQGGISNGEDIYFSVAFKAVSSIKKEQQSVDNTGKKVNLTIKGRHDVCPVPRAVPIVEAMAALVIADSIIFIKK